MANTYDTYKDSGVAWIGKIPNEWKIVRQKNIFSLTKILVEESWETTPLLSLTTKGIKCIDIGTTSGKVPDSYNTYQIVKPGDLVMCLFDLDCSAVFSGLSKTYGMISPAYKVLKVNEEYDPLYYSYWFDYIFDGRKFMYLSKNIRYSLTYDEFASLNIPNPSYAEQKTIASFLDKKCVEIDSLIALQDEMISELQAYKQSVITETVTKGLDSNAKMKNSGVEWIGEIPEGWDVKPFKYIFKTGKGLSFTKADLVNEGVPVISYGQVHSKQNKGTQIVDSLIRFVPVEMNSPLAKVHIGDFIFADTSEDLEGCGNCVYIDKEIGLYAGYHSVIAHAQSKSSNLYLAYLFLTNCWRSQIRSRVSGIKVLSISQSIINQTTVILPHLSEQRAITSYLDEKTAQIDALISLKQEKIAELKNYKKSIIYEYVTGKKRV